MLKIREGSDAKLTNKQISDALYGVKEKEVENMLDRLKLIERYLKHINSERRYSLAHGKDNHFINLQAIIENARQHGYTQNKITNIKNAVFQLIFEGKKHEDIRKINKSINAELQDAVESIVEAGGKIDISQNKPVEKTLQKEVDTEVNEGEEEENDDELTETDTHFRDLVDELNVHENKNHISLLLKTAEKNLKVITEESEFDEEIKKPEIISLVKKIFQHVQKLQEKISG